MRAHIWYHPGSTPSQPLGLFLFGLLLVSILGLMLVAGSLIPGDSAW